MPWRTGGVQYKDAGVWKTNVTDIAGIVGGRQYRVGFQVTNTGSETYVKNVQVRVVNNDPARVTSTPTTRTQPRRRIKSTRAFKVLPLAGSEHASGSGSTSKWECNQICRCSLPVSACTPKSFRRVTIGIVLVCCSAKEVQIAVQPTSSFASVVEIWRACSAAKLSDRFPIIGARDDRADGEHQDIRQRMRFRPVEPGSS